MLSLRLKTLRDCYQNEESVWDIGCDHGLLGSSFRDIHSVKQIHLVDPSLPVINVLKNTIDSYITIPDLIISIHHSRGQDIQLSTQNNLIFIAGMGGKEIQEILHSLIPQLSTQDRVVISPHRKILELRSYLNSSALKLEREFSLEENEQFYQAMILTKKAHFSEVSLYGEEIWTGEVGRKYRIQQLTAMKSHQDEASQAYWRYLNSLR